MHNARHRTVTFSRGMWCSPPERFATSSWRLCSTKPTVKPPNIPPLPEQFRHFRRELGAQVYGSMGIGKDDTEKHAAAVMRNWEFFRAPLAGIICMHQELGPADAVSVGMFLQTFLLALTERGLGSCVEVSVVGYPDIVRAQLGISEPSYRSCVASRSVTPTRNFQPTISMWAGSRYWTMWFSWMTEPLIVLSPRPIRRSTCVIAKMRSRIRSAACDIIGHGVHTRSYAAIEARLATDLVPSPRVRRARSRSRRPPTGRFTLRWSNS